MGTHCKRRRNHDWRTISANRKAGEPARWVLECRRCPVRASAMEDRA